MARLFSSGFELNSTGVGVEFTSTSGGPVIQTSTIKGGTYAAQITSLVSATAKYFRYTYGASNLNGPLFFRFYFNAATLPSAANRIIAIRRNAGTQECWISIDNTGVLQLADTGGNIGSASSALSTGTWYRIEIKVDTTGTAGHHIIEARLNGKIFATSSTRTIAGVNDFQIGGNLNSEAQTTGNWFFDDIAINDSTGSNQNNYPDEGIIVHLQPNAMGDNNQFTTQTGGTAGSTNNYTRVNEITPNDATSFNADNTLNDTDDFNLLDTPSAILSGTLIKLVQIGVRFSGAGASANSSFVVRCKKGATGTVVEGNVITPSDTTWNTNATAAPLTYTLTLYSDPDNNPWTKSSLDSAQIGYRISTNNTNNAQISTVWMLVEYDTTTTPIFEMDNQQGMIQGVKIW